MKLSVSILLAFLLFAPITYARIWTPAKPDTPVFLSDRYWRTELYVGMGKRDGTEVTEDEWQRFLTDEVTPRFPDGLTIIEARGQYRNASGKIIRERSRVLILLYPKKQRSEANKKIDAICAAYKRIFQQESVLRVTASRSSIVSF